MSETENPVITPAAPLAERLDAWARRKLELPAGADRVACGISLLKRLQDDEWRLDPEVIEAYECLNRPSAPGPVWSLPTEFVDSETDRLEDQITLFADELFTLSPEARHARFHELELEVAPFPALRARLQRLQPAIAEQSETLMNDDCAAVAESLRELLCLDPVERVERRHELLAQWWREPVRWADAIAKVQQVAPHLCSFDPALSEWLQLQRPRRAVRDKSKSEELAARLLSGSSEKPIATDAETSLLDRFVDITVTVIAIFVCSVVAAAMWFSMTSPPPSPPEPVRWQPDRPWGDPQPWRDRNFKRLFKSIKESEQKNPVTQPAPDIPRPSRP